MESKTERYYYLRDDQNSYLGCVCILRDPKTGNFHRGISLCNTNLDKFIKKRARGIAYSRALSAQKNSEDSNCLVKSGVKILDKSLTIAERYGLNIVTTLLSNSHVELSARNVHLTGFEKRMWNDVLNPYKEEK